MPAPQPQFWIKVNGVEKYRLDLAYPRWKIAVEYDGEEFHSSPEDRDQDERRRTWLRRRGWIVIVVTKEDFRRSSKRRLVAASSGPLWTSGCPRLASRRYARAERAARRTASQ